jgi:hypothetical protein
MTKPQAYPFLISRNYNQDYRLVYAPLFCQSPEFAGLLFDATGNAVETENHDILTATLNLPSSTLPCKLFYRVTHAKGYDIGEDTPKKLTDNVGRIIYHIEGIIVDKSFKLSSSSIDKEQFDHLVHDPLMLHYKEFWQLIPKSTAKKPDYVISLSSLFTDEIIYIPEEKSRKDSVKQDERTKLKMFKCMLRYFVGLGLFTAITVLIVSQMLDRKDNELDIKTGEMLRKNGNNDFPRINPVRILTLSQKYNPSGQGNENLNCIALNRIMAFKSEGKKVSVMLDESLTATGNTSIRADIEKLKMSRSACKKKMKNLSFTANQYLNFLRF